MEKNLKDKKEMVYQSAVEVISREGFHNATVEKIASSAGVAVGTVYNHFLNKNDILDYIFQKEFEKRKRYFLEIKKKDLHPLEKLKSILSMHFEEVKENQEVFSVILRERGMYKVCHSQGITRFECLPSFIEEILIEGVNSGTLRSCDLKVIALVIFGAIEGLMSRYLYELEEKGHSTLLDNAAEEIAQIMWQGLNN